MADNIREKLEKILRLAERGVGGEKVNAQRQLDKLLKKYELTLNDIKRPEKQMYWFKPVGQFEKGLLLQCYAIIVNTAEPMQYKRPREKGYELTPRQYLELCSMFDYYKRRWEKDLHIFFIAFIQKQNLFPQALYQNPKTNFSEQELKKHRQAERMADGIEKGSYVGTRRQIGVGV